MREIFQNELDSLADGLTAMARKAAEAIDGARRALETNNLELAESVIAADAEIDRMQHKLDQDAAEILALQAPVARDLRVVVSALRMSASLERMGDLARHVAQQVRIRFPQHAVPTGFEQTFAQMADAAKAIADATVSLLSNPGLDDVPEINKLDEDLDELHLKVFTLIGSSDLKPAQVADVTLLSRYFERFGDHAVSVSQRVEYLLTGEWTPDLSAK